MKGRKQISKCLKIHKWALYDIENTKILRDWT